MTTSRPSCLCGALTVGDLSSNGWQGAVACMGMAGSWTSSAGATMTLGKCLLALISSFLQIATIGPCCITGMMGLLDTRWRAVVCGLEADEGIGSDVRIIKPSGEWLSIFLLLILLTTESWDSRLSPISPKSRRDWSCSIVGFSLISEHSFEHFWMSSGHLMVHPLSSTACSSCVVSTDLEWSVDEKSPDCWCYSCGTDSRSMHTWYVRQAHLFSLTVI